MTSLNSCQVKLKLIRKENPICSFCCFDSKHCLRLNCFWFIWQVAVATDRRCLRLFSVGGMQREVLSLPGPVVSLAGQGPYLAVAVHLGMPLPGNQNIGVSVFNVGSLRKRTIHPMPTFQPIPLAPKSTLSWFGFTDENNVSINVKKDQNCQINASIDKLNLLFEAQICPYIASWFIVCPIRFSKQVRITSFSE